ncbi:hypothetical protein LJC60_01025 [Ruminococcaceae bacterium OttesenSCG-928-D13]|nr:hypothetical protein [Ruminococcaceae bacterium OttesenSCG-928-D13]
MDRLSDVNYYYSDSADGCTCTISRQWHDEAKARLSAYEDLGAPEQLAARVEVVRCIDCKHADSAGNHVYCMRLGTKLFRWDGFCSFGEQQEVD